MTKPVFRFAPSPNGRLHLGHAYSALLNAKMASGSAGRFLLRMEDIDTERCTPELEQGIYDDLRWLGLAWEEPVRRQSEHFSEYRNALTRLADKGLVYPAFLSRAQIHSLINDSHAKGTPWPTDPDGTPLYPQGERNLTEQQQLEHMATGMPYAWRLDMEKALAAAGVPLFWRESGAGPQGETGSIAADPARWGDVVIARKDTPTSYHLSVVVDDALQGVTHIVRGRDLFHATSVHRLLQKLLDLPEPLYHHHDLILAENGFKLSKSRKDTALESLREQGWTPDDIRARLKL
ncbi:tRNA glutamyl-Q(34) synthetase GluQRS [Falsochrobactrum sp. TDYN1]|uniref:tRNA glutamyl-Q(34) synthetase GluQRS n=1 Tax=Falsochrobactrum tianjinense TaxID=2706015 RepID=A0A949PPM0_9HYPH|nr:tRNA glutamyl-Q(34) synthetase GluQRS [Falsochrobactrum sp. TDYN1]MBV2144678.1 tRNA glutamyl-Q(34) synthetase GluQRS [Falsochrobactrum sp. TDYN1]